ncbi:uncharacterized protein [Typha angustifolia]|uniref:uncharacterized protein n=1 Tax=Typha angustifolia TaxID=59011 RepID=UPI003C2C9E44
MQSRRSGGREGRGGSNRYLSPNPRATAIGKMKEHHADDWHHKPFARRSRPSVSPPMRGRPLRSSARRNASIERREYAPWSAEFGKHADINRDHGYKHQARSQPFLFEDQGYDPLPDYMLPDYPSDLNQKLKPSRPIMDKDFLYQGNGSSTGLQGQSLRIQKSVYLDDGPDRSFFSRPTETAAPKPGNIVGGSRYQERGRENIYSSRGAPFPEISGTSSSTFAKDDELHLYGDQLHQPSDAFARDNPGDFSDDHIDRTWYGHMRLSDSMRGLPSSQSPIDEPRNYPMQELTRRGREDRGSLASDDIYKKNSWCPRDDYRDALGPSFTYLPNDMADRVGSSQRVANKSSFLDSHHSLRRDATLRYDEMKGVHEDYAGGSGTRLHGLTLKSHEIPPAEENHDLVRYASFMAYRERPKNPMFPNRHMDISQQNVSPRREESHFEDMDTYNLSSERMVRKRYLMDDDNEYAVNSRIIDHTGFRRIMSAADSDDIWLKDDNKGHLPSKKLAFGRPSHKMTSHKISQGDAWSLPRDNSAHEESGCTRNIKKRLKPSPLEFSKSFTSERNELFRPYKIWKRTLKGQYTGWKTNNCGDVPDDTPLSISEDPPEGSEEYKKQVHKAFLRFSKLLNESTFQQKRYREPGKGTLLCCVCGSHSKEFTDIHSLITHSYHSRKVGVKTDHLGLHKALCVLMGWNWLVAPDNSKAYQSSPVAEANFLKEDLILWPPLVILHNSSIEKKVTKNEARIVTNEGIEEILTDIGIGSGKAKISYGKPANQSMFLVKFMPTFSGLQEAEKLHKHFADRKRGKQEFQQIKISNGKMEAPVKKVEELLYGYMASTEDMHKLDAETKKRCLVKSKKDIEAIADAPLNAD